MTVSPDDSGRDWDAEFAEITGRLGLADHEQPPGTRGANRDTFTHGQRPEPPVAATETPASEASGPSGELGTAASDAAATPRPIAHALHDEPAIQTERSGLAGEFDAHPTVASEHHTAADDSDDGDFVPPRPAPLETDDPATIIMIGCLVAGPLWLLYLTIFDRDTAPLWWLLAALTLTAGFGLAVMRQPRKRDDEDDDGARV